MNQWGPALLVVFTVVLGVVFNNSRISDLRSHVDSRMDDFNNRLNDLKDFIRSEIRRLEQRIERLEQRVEHPVHRP